MEIKEFKKYVRDIDCYSSSEIDGFEFMTDKELDNIFIELEADSGNNSDWDYLKAFITYKKRIEDLKKGK
jgi:hypothetical protein